MSNNKPTYTMSKAALAVRQAAGARSAAVRGPARTWRTVRVDAETLARIKVHRLAGESLADVLRRLVPPIP